MFQTLKKAGKRLIASSSLLHLLYIHYYVRKTKSLAKAATRRLKSAGLEVVTMEGVRNELYDSVLSSKSDTCHIIGSGWSLNQSKKLIRDTDFVIGFNQSAMADLPFDLYFIEFGGEKVKTVVEQQMRLVEKKLTHSGALVLFKNLWDEKNDTASVIKYWGNDVKYLLDCLVPIMSDDNISQAMDYLIKENSEFLQQSTATVLGGINMAQYLGFREIVIHGLDFGGNYFFDAKDFEGDKSLRPIPTKGKQDYYGKQNEKSTHQTADSSLSQVGLKSVLPVIHEKLQNTGVQLMAASQVSPASKILPVWVPEDV